MINFCGDEGPVEKACPAEFCDDDYVTRKSGPCAATCSEVWK